MHVVAVGKEITEARISEARNRMRFYGLEEKGLVVIQANGVEDLVMVTHLNSAEQANAVLSSQIADLQRQLAAYVALDTLSVRVASEAQTLFPEVQHVAVGRLGGEPVALVEWRGEEKSVENKERLEAWLRTRVQDKNLEVIIK